VKNKNFAALFFYGLTVGVSGGLGMALYLYNTTYFFGFSGPQIAAIGVGVLVSPAIAYWAAPFSGAALGNGTRRSAPFSSTSPSTRSRTFCC
jgi:hypothetical protein